MENFTTDEVIKEAGQGLIGKPKLSARQQVKHMRDKKGIKFTIITEDEAENFLRDSSYYFKVKAFRKNYSKYNSGENQGKYYNLEFAYLKELSTLDMYLREIILSMVLDIEHYLKVQLLNDISENSEEDGYKIVRTFFEHHPSVKDRITQKAENSYCANLVHVYGRNFAAWNIVEVLSFGDLLNLCDLYYSEYPGRKINVGDFRIVKFLRNAAAHNNCLINNLADNSGTGFKQNRTANLIVSEIKEISPGIRQKKMGNRFVHDFVVMLCCFNTIVSSQMVKKYQFEKLKKLIDERFILRKDYFLDNALLVSNYNFAKKIVDKFADTCV